MIAAPRLWRCLVADWFSLEPGLAWSLWHSLIA
jgi:hypothetical protein